MSKDDEKYNPPSRIPFNLNMSKAIEKLPDGVHKTQIRNYFLVGNLLMTGDYGAAEALLKKVLRSVHFIYPKNSIHYLLSLSLLLQHKYPQAETEIRKAIGQNTEPSADYYLILGQVLFFQCDYLKAEVELNNAFRHNPSSKTEKSLYYWLGLSLAYQNELDQAELMFRKALKLDKGKDPLIEIELSKTLINKGKHKGALSNLRKALKISKDEDTKDMISFLICLSLIKQAKPCPPIQDTKDGYEFNKEKFMSKYNDLERLAEQPKLAHVMSGFVGLHEVERIIEEKLEALKKLVEGKIMTEGPYQYDKARRMLIEKNGDNVDLKPSHCHVIEALFDKSDKKDKNLTLCRLSYKELAEKYIEGKGREIRARGGGGKKINEFVKKQYKLLEEDPEKICYDFKKDFTRTIQKKHLINPDDLIDSASGFGYRLGGGWHPRRPVIFKSEVPLVRNLEKLKNEEEDPLKSFYKDEIEEE